MKRLILITALLLNCNFAYAGFAEHYSAGQQYLTQYQYSSAITEFRKALRINYLDNSARIGLVNAYLARGTHIANNDKNWESAANDYRAALFYLKYYPSPQDVINSSTAIANSTENLSQCLTAQKYNTTAQARYQKARELRNDGLFAEAGYEFAQSANDQSLRKVSFEQIADIMKVLGNDQKALEYYQKAVAIGQEDAALRLKYARVLDKLGQSDLAVQEYNFALTKSENDPEVLYSLERIYRIKLEQNPKDAEVIANLGAILQKQNKLDEALEYYKKAGEINPSNVTTRLNLGTLYQQKKSYDAAIAAYDTILVLYPDNLLANYYKGQCLAASGRYEEAKKVFNKVLAIDPTNKDAKVQLFDIMKNTMPAQQMLAELSKQAAIDHDCIDDMYDYALELHKKNKYDDAITYYKEVLKFRSNNAEVYINMAIAYNQKKETAQAIKILEEAKVKFPNNKQIQENLSAFVQNSSTDKLQSAAELYNAGNYQKALSVYQSIQPPTAESWMGLAACYKGLKNTKEAIEAYKKALLVDPNNSDVAYYIGVLYTEIEDWYQSKIYLKKSLSLDKNNSRASDLYQSVVEQCNVKLLDQAIGYYDKNDYIQSLKLLNQILADDSKNAYAYYYRGLIADAQKKYANALIDYKKALQFGPELNILHYLMALDYDALGQYKNALASYRKYISITTEKNEYKTYSESRVKDLKRYE